MNFAQCQCRTQGGGGGGGLWGTTPPEGAVSVLIFFAYFMILRVYTVMVWGGFVEVWGVLWWFGVFWGCFNGRHDGYANS